MCDAGNALPTFALVKLSIDNSHVKMRPYGQSMFADAVNTIQAVDLAYNAMMGEIDNGKVRVSLSDAIIDVERDGKSGRAPIGSQPLHKLMSHALRAHDLPGRGTTSLAEEDDQGQTLRIAL